MRNKFGFEVPALPADATTSPPPSPFFQGADADLSAALPPEARRRFLLLRDASADSASVGRGLAERLVDEVDRRRRASLRLAEIRSRFGTAADHPEVINQTRIITEADAEVERINERAAANGRIAGPRAELLRNCEAWIRNTAPGHDLVDIELVEPPKLLKGETAATAIERVRRRLREWENDARRIEASPYPAAVAKAVAAQHIAELADAAAPIVSSCVEFAGPLMIDGKVIEPPIVFPTRMAKLDVNVRATVPLEGVPSSVAGKGVATGETVDTVGLLCWLFKDQVLARIGEAIDAEYDPSTRDAALTREQRAEQLATIATDREHAEQDEAYLLWTSYDAGVIVEPRATMSPAAFLGVQAIRADRRPGYDHADGITRGRRAHSAEGQPAGPNDVRIPGLNA